jgi:hypothetical protein
MLRGLIIIIFGLTMFNDCADKKTSLSFDEIWLPENIEWEKPPFIENNNYTGDCSILYFQKDGIFKMINFFLYKASKIDTIYLGAEGGAVYQGSWENIEDNLLVEYKLKEQLIGLLNYDETTKDTIKLIKNNNSINKIVFRGEKYISTYIFDEYSLNQIKRIYE